MSVRETKKSFTHRGKKYTAILRERPFREGIEVTLNYEGGVIHVAEFGLGIKALIQKLKSELDGKNR